MSHACGWTVIFKMTMSLCYAQSFGKGYSTKQNNQNTNKKKNPDRSHVQRWNAQNKWAGRQTKSSWKYFTSDLKNEQLPHCSSQGTQYSRVQRWSSEEMGTHLAFSFMLLFFLLERYCLPKRNFSSTGKTIFPIDLRKPKIPNGIKMIFPLPPP